MIPNIGSGDGLSLIKRQAITWTNANLLSIGPLERKPRWNFNRSTNHFIPDNVFVNGIYKMPAICSGVRFTNFNLSMDK